MATISFWARGDSSTANNAAINSQGISTTPTTQLTFTSDSGGDLTLDYNGTGYDPDTQVIVNGVLLQFRIEFTGTLPQVNKLTNIDGTDVRGEAIAVITTSDGQRFYFLTDGSGTFSLMNAMPNGALAINNTNTTDPVVVCFVQGALIATPAGEVPVQNLRVGDLVLTLDHGPQPLRWIGRRAISDFEALVYPDLRPVLLPAHSIAPGQPHSPLHLSPQHRVLVGGGQVEMLFGLPEALVAAVHLPQAEPLSGGCVYYHLLFDRHEIVLSNGLLSESFQPGAVGLGGMDAATRAEVERLFPEVAGAARAATPGRPDGRPSLRGYESRALAAAVRRAA